MGHDNQLECFLDCRTVLYLFTLASDKEAWTTSRSRNGNFCEMRSQGGRTLLGREALDCQRQHGLVSTTTFEKPEIFISRW